MCPTLSTSLANPAGLPDPPAPLSQQALMGLGFRGHGLRGTKLLLEESWELRCSVLPLAAAILGHTELEAYCLWRGYGPADTLTLEFWPPAP